MRHETNNEMDLLLRRLGGRDGGSLRGAEAQHDDGHLDADELNSYAQNALPAPARARYTEHLAECGSCRKLVTELCLSLGAVAAVPVETVPTPAGLKKFLAGLFSPLVLRYAVPALGLLVAAVVGFVVLRQQQSQPFMARVDESHQQPAAKQFVPPTAPSPAQLNDEPRKEIDSTPKPGQGVTSPSEGKPQSRGVEDKEAPAPVQRGKEESSAAAAEPAPSATPQPPAAPKTVAASEVEAQKQTVIVAKKQPAATIDKTTADGDVAKPQANENNFRRIEPLASERADQNKAKTGSADTKPGSSDSGGFMAGGLRRAARARGQEAKDDADTRSIAGRRFRKERGIWTDTAYDSSTATVNVARGSEQFRALIADEPEIETIAKQLEGEVIVVWKGRAYRIR
jgi:hypothetical protein